MLEKLTDQEIYTEQDLEDFNEEQYNKNFEIMLELFKDFKPSFSIVTQKEVDYLNLELEKQEKK